MVLLFLLLGLTYLDEEHSCGTVTDSNRLLNCRSPRIPWKI